MEPFVLWMCIPLCIYFVAHYYQHWNVRNKYSYCSVECTSIILKWFTNNPQNFFLSFSPLAPKMTFYPMRERIDGIFSHGMKNDFCAKKGQENISWDVIFWFDWQCLSLVPLGIFGCTKIFCANIMKWYSRKKRHLWKRYEKVSHSNSEFIKTCMNVWKEIEVYPSCKVISKRNINNNNSDTDSDNKCTIQREPKAHWTRHHHKIHARTHTHKQTRIHKSHKTIPSEPPESFT